MKLDIILASSDAGIHIDGAKNGAIKLGEDILNKTTIVQKDFKKNKLIFNKKKNLKQVNCFNKELYEKVTLSLEKGNKVFTIGGDHSIAIGSALASVKKNKKMGIIWIDAHGDYNTFKTTITGNLHGLPLAVIDNYEKNLLNEFHDGNYFDPQNTVIIGGRDFDKLEYKNLTDAGVKIYTSDYVNSHNISEIVKESIAIASNNTNKLHISFDIDVIDPKIARGVSVPAKNGISDTSAYEIISEILKYKEYISTIDLVEYNPLFDIDNETYLIAKKIRDKIIKELIQE